MARRFPGSKMIVPEYNTRPQTEIQEEPEFGKARTFLVSGQPRDFYGVGDLARALNRKAVTIRKWEAEGTIPNATFILPSDDSRGRRRLYTHQQIAGLKQIALEEGLLEPNANGKWKSIEETNFRDRALRLFKELEKK